MASIGKQVGEKLHGPLYTFSANEGTFTETTVYEVGGQIKSGTNYKVGTLSAPLVKGDLVKVDTGADSKVMKVAATDNKADHIMGVVVDSPYGDPETGRKVLVQMFEENDVLVLEAAGAIARGSGINISALDADKPHGVTVAADGTADALGFALNSAGAAGDKVKVWLKPGRL